MLSTSAQLLFWTEIFLVGASLVVQMVMNLSGMLETRVWSLGWEDPLEKEWQPASVFLPGKFHEQMSLEGYSPWSHKESDMTEHLHTHTQTPTLCTKKSHGINVRIIWKCMNKRLTSQSTAKSVTKLRRDHKLYLERKVKVKVTQLHPALCDPKFSRPAYYSG